MTDAEIFHRETTHYGGRLQVPSDSTSENIYATIKQRAECLIACAREQIPSLSHIHFDVVLNGNINAFAFKSEGRYFIGLTTGAFFMLQLVFLRMLSDSRLFDFVGNPNEEATDLPPLTDYIPEAQQMYETGHKPKSPKTKKRFFYANRLIDRSLLFLIGHEIAHITLGHVDYNQSKTGLNLISELAWNEPNSKEVIERQCLEMQADTRSVFSGIESLKLAHAKMEKQDWTDSVSSEGNLIFDWAFAVNSLFRLFGDQKFNGYHLVTNSHPPFPLRRAMATATAYAAIIENWNSSLKEKAQNALRTATKYTEHSFSAILGENMTAEGLNNAYSPLGQEHHKRLIKYSSELEKRLAPFSYEKIFSR